MEFAHEGVRYSLDADVVRAALRGCAPEDVRTHWVDVDGIRWPPKQVFGLATGLDRSTFTSHRALDILGRLGFRTSSWRSGRQTTGTVRTTNARTQAPSPVRSDRPVGSAAADDPGAGVVLVGCSGSKAPGPAPAAELFTGVAFRKARDLAARSGKPWYVLSAKFGLLHPDEVIASYDAYLPKQSARYRSAWADWVVAQLGERHALRGMTVEAHAGGAYCEPLIRPLANVGATLTQPLAGLGLGRRLAWYGSSPGSPDESAVDVPGPPDVTSLLDERHAVPPEEFLAAGRTSSDRPGLYSWWADTEGARDLSAGLGHRVPPGLVYAGRAGGVRPNGVSSTNTLRGRVATMHLGGNRNFSTFRLTLAACLSRPGQPPIAEADLTTWMHAHLRVATLPLPPEQVTAGEIRLLELTDAPLNLRDVPPTPLRKALSTLRSAIRER
ncbi:DUF6884 domain-containing protein [Blastococcus capsensis]|uniref:DUF6884 domain-containing protein n=1 Tax=Blastococcus capsensis TaxID=1564163 RepID=UPI0025404C2C|nr:DUF6884 domain-containing protein [Blastococcus capsensis]MDK3256583.1 hypothetical protein [Blastococcus capsensis]